METHRELTPYDYLAVWNLAQDLQKAGEITAGFFWPPELLMAEFQTHRSWGIFAEEKELAALLIFKEQPAAIEILTLVTRPDFRGRGLMQKLLKNLQAQVSAPQEIWLEVHIENISARNLYEKMGFVVVAERPKYYRDGKAALAMSWKPEPSF